MGGSLPKSPSSTDASNYTDDEWAFMAALDAYKRLRGRPWPTWREVLAVLVSLGYRRVAEATVLPQPIEIAQRTWRT